MKTNFFLLNRLPERGRSLKRRRRRRRPRSWGSSTWLARSRSRSHRCTPPFRLSLKIVQSSNDHWQDCFKVIRIGQRWFIMTYAVSDQSLVVRGILGLGYGNWIDGFTLQSPPSPWISTCNAVTAPNFAIFGNGAESIWRWLFSMSANHHGYAHTQRICTEFNKIDCAMTW